MDNLLATLEAARVRFVRVCWCDVANLIRGKAIHTGSLENDAQLYVNVTQGLQGVPATVDSVIAASGLSPVGEIRLQPDWDTLRSLPYASGHARVMGDMTVDGQPWGRCPRHFLRRMEKRGQELGLQFSAAYENEFYLLKPDGSPADDTLFASVYSMNHNRAMIDELTEWLQAQRMVVEQYYPESGPGQQELSIRHAPPLEAADNQVAFRETVHAAAARHGLLATFLPKPIADKAGSGCHLHLSFNDFGGEKWGLSERAQSFIAGVLEHLAALMAITAPIPNSYLRLQPHCWSGAYRCWGLNNREAAVRVLPTNLELKTVDAASNPYLALGAVLAAGLDGVQRQLTLEEPMGVDPGNLPDGPPRTPAVVGEALDHLEKDQVLLDALGPELALSFLAVRRAEVEALEKLDKDEAARLLRHRY